jgi:uncharacterized membrane protein YqjE
MREGESPADPPELSQAAQDLGRAALGAGRSAWHVTKTFRTLLAADLSLSRSALGMTLAFAAVGIVLGASAWLLLMTLLVVALRELGLGWLVAIAIPALLSLAGAALCMWRASIAFADTRLNATRRQLARFGLGEDPAALERHPEHLP